MARLLILNMYKGHKNVFLTKYVCLDWYNVSLKRIKCVLSDNKYSQIKLDSVWIHINIFYFCLF